jgi:hypothetical protein
VKKILENIQCDRKHYYQLLMQNISKYIYREKRYNAHFSLIAICSKEDIEVDIEKLRNELRQTDTLVKINEELTCIVLDNTSNDSYVKAAENLTKTLQKLYFNKNFYISTANSEEFDHNYLDMSNKLFERLEYAIKNTQCNTVVYQDYII